MAGEKLVSLMQRTGTAAASRSANFLRGTVISTAPLQIRVSDKLIIPGDFIILSKSCKKFELKLAGHYHMTGDGLTSTELREILLWDDLKIGEVVRLLALNDSNMYYALERE